MADIDLQRLARLVASTTEMLRGELSGLDADGASFHPAPGEWCAKEIVGHLTEADRRGFSGRIRIILANDRPQLDTWDQPAVATARGDCAKQWPEVLAEFTLVRNDGLALFEELSDADLDRVGIHPEVGELAVRDLLHEWPFHDREHLKQLLENTRQLLWADMGNSRGFSAVD